MKPLIEYVPRGWWGLPVAGALVICVEIVYSLLLIGAAKAFPFILDGYNHAGVVEKQLFGIPCWVTLAGVSWLTFQRRRLFSVVLALYVATMGLWTVIFLTRYS